MRIGVCDRNEMAVRQLVGWITRYCESCAIEPEIGGYINCDDMILAASIYRFDLFYISFDGPDGFLSARRVRDKEKTSKIILISDSAEYALMGMRLHVIDYIVKPVAFEDIARAMKRAGIGGA